ncbi:MAG TPA: CotH kinase family protein, partial [Symbiobacteriaceae bacterium]|nr:CotH kinase family protein [Symbiobacteriaceae bacterium]
MAVRDAVAVPVEAAVVPVAAAAAVPAVADGVVPTAEAVVVRAAAGAGPVAAGAVPTVATADALAVAGAVPTAAAGGVRVATTVPAPAVPAAAAVPIVVIAPAVTDARIAAGRVAAAAAPTAATVLAAAAAPAAAVRTVAAAAPTAATALAAAAVRTVAAAAPTAATALAAVAVRIVAAAAPTAATALAAADAPTAGALAGVPADGPAVAVAAAGAVDNAHIPAQSVRGRRRAAPCTSFRSGVIPVPLAEYHLKMDPADLRWFHSHAGTQRCFPALLETESASCPVWVGYRGRYSRNFRKPSYDIWFGDDHLPDWGPELHLNAAYRDPSLMRSRLSFDLFHKLGVAVPRCRHIWLCINDMNEGVYTAVEAVDQAWLKRQGLPDGPIYFAVGSKGNFGLIDQDTGRPKRYINAGYEKRHPADDDFGDLEELIEAVTLPTVDEFPDQIRRTIDVDNCLRWLIGMEFVSHTDGIVQNYALYRAATGQWR